MKKALSSVCPDNYVQKCYNAFVCSVCQGSVCFVPSKTEMAKEEEFGYILFTK